MAPGASLVYRQMTRLAWRNVLRNWRHSLATILAIASGFMAVSLFDGFIRELQYRNYDGYSTRGMLGHVLVQRKDAQLYGYDDQWQYALNQTEQKFLDGFFAQDPAFKLRVRFLSMAGLVNAGPQNAVFIGLAYDQKDGAALRGDRWYWNVLAGEPIVRAKQPAVQLGQGLGHLLGCASEYHGPSVILEDGNYVPEVRPFKCEHPRVTISATTEAAQVNAIDLPVWGLYDAGFREADKRALSMDLSDGQKLLDTDKITMMSVLLTDKSESHAFAGRLKAASTAAGFAFDVMPWEEHSIAAYVQGGMQILRVFRNLFMVIVVTIGVMSVANTMMKSVNERTREIGTLRSLGFYRRHLVYMFALEGTFLSILACVLGLGLALVATVIIGHLGLSYRAGVLSVPIQLRVMLAPSAWAFSAILLSVLATGTAYFCARRASRMVIADAMRHI